MTRSEELISAVKQQAADWLNWQEDENRPNPDDELFASLVAMFDVFAAGEIPSDCRVLELNVSALKAEWDKYDNRENVNQTNFDELFKAARERLVAGLEVQERPADKVLLSIKHFREVEKCTDSQIAAIYDFTDRRGYSLPHLVQLELDNPGSVTQTPGAVDGRDWVCPDSMVWNPDPSAAKAQAVHDDDTGEIVPLVRPPKLGERQAKSRKRLAA